MFLLLLALFLNWVAGVYYYSIKFNKIEEIALVDETQEYIDMQKTAFLALFDKATNFNSNIDDIFYVKPDFQKALIEEDNFLEKQWKMRILFESTPRGNIVMHYNPYKLGFSYYADTNSIPYSVLNSVAMKYVRAYFCIDFFVDNETTNKPSPFIELYLNEQQSTENKKTLQKLDSTAFAKFKNYKNVEKKTTETSENKVPPKIEYIRNKFVYMGKLVNFQLLQKPKVIHKTNGFHSNLLDGVVTEAALQKEVLSYKDFKLAKNK